VTCRHSGEWAQPWVQFLSCALGPSMCCPFYLLRILIAGVFKTLWLSGASSIQCAKVGQVT
jgi:hypothetical protein